MCTSLWVRCQRGTLVLQEVTWLFASSSNQLWVYEHWSLVVSIHWRDVSWWMAFICIKHDEGQHQHTFDTTSYSNVYWCCVVLLLRRKLQIEHRKWFMVHSDIGCSDTQRSLVLRKRHYHKFFAWLWFVSLTSAQTFVCCREKQSRLTLVRATCNFYSNIWGYYNAVSLLCNVTVTVLSFLCRSMDPCN